MATLKKNPTLELLGGAAGGGCRGIDNATEPFGEVTVPRGRCRFVAASLKRMLSTAYKVPRDKIVDGPSWVEDDRFDLEASSGLGETATKEQLLQMLQSLLKERFKLSFKNQDKEEIRYALLPLDISKLRELSPDAKRTPSSFDPGRWRFQGRIGLFAVNLANYLQIPVEDQTGLRAAYDINLTWMPDAEIGKANAGIILDGALFNALKEQLGLRLETQRVRATLLSIETVQRPSP